jgi:hypothetical protein
MLWYVIKVKGFFKCNYVPKELIVSYSRRDSHEWA